MWTARSLSLFLLCTLEGGAMAAPLDYDEAVLGDLSGDHAAPTPLLFAPGRNLLKGAMGPPGFQQPVDRDIWSFTIAEGYELFAIPVLFREPVDNSFIAIQRGTSISPNDPFVHLSNALVGPVDRDILVAFDEGPEYGGEGFDGPLGAGTYTMWFQELANRNAYTLAFDVRSVPEPGPTALALGGGMALLLRRRRRF